MSVGMYLFNGAKVSVLSARPDEVVCVGLAKKLLVRILARKSQDRVFFVDNMYIS